MRRLIRIRLERGFSAALEFRRQGRSTESWSLTLVVPEGELARFGEGGALDLIDFATELQDSIGRDHAA